MFGTCMKCGGSLNISGLCIKNSGNPCSIIWKAKSKDSGYRLLS
jgi:hypothetical protein